MSLVLFTASWCKPCKELKEWLAENKLDHLATEHVDIDESPAEALNSDVYQVPAMVLDGVLYTGRETIKPFLSDKYLDQPQKTVIKRDGTRQPFDKSKIYRWAAYAAKHGVDFKVIADQTISRLTSETSTEEIHETMMNVCLDKEQLDYSRVASRLLYAQLRKNMKRIWISDRGTFKAVYDRYVSLGMWSGFEYHECMEAQYEELFSTHLEFWQVRQWMDKYSLKANDVPVETPHIGALALGHAIHGNTPLAFKTAKAIIQGKLNLPTPALNGIRNGDWNTISCSVMEGGDTIPSIGVADHLAYMMTAKKAGIGIKFVTRSINDAVKGGAVKHLGKLPIYATVDKSVKMFTQVSRGGSATVSFSVYDPEVREIIMVKSQRTPENKRIDKLDYSMCYDDAFVEAVIKNTDIQTVSVNGKLGPVYNARDLLKDYLTIRKETGRLYCFNLSQANYHTPFLDPINQSNLCLEIAIPTAPFVDMVDLYTGEDSEGEMGFCTLAAINVTNVSDEEYEGLACVAVATLNELLIKAHMFSPALENKLRARSSLGIGITGLAGYLAKHNKLYADSDFIEALAEKHYFYLLKASIAQAGKYGAVEGIKTDWLPIDTKATKREPTLDWESLRGKPRANSVLVAHMPTESSAVFSNATNGVYPVRNRVINKQSRKGSVQYIAPAVKELAWDIDNITLSKAYGAIQAYTDQSISADYYVGNGKVSLGQMMKEWVAQAKHGVKSMYYLNTNDFNGGSFQDQQGCESGACRL